MPDTKEARGCQAANSAIFTEIINERMDLFCICFQKIWCF